MKLENKREIFADKCGDWDYRNIDMTEPHLQGIDIIQNTIIINCELYSPELDEYLSCEGGVI